MNLHPKTSFAFHWYHPNLWWYSISWILPADLPEIFLPLEVFTELWLSLDTIRNIWEDEAIKGTCFNFLINQNRFSFLLITWSEKCIVQTKTCLNSLSSLQFRNPSKVFLCCSSSGNWKNALSRVRHGLWSIRERCICWLFSCHIPFSKIKFPFHLEKNLNFQRYNFLIGILDVCRIPRIRISLRCACYFIVSQCVKALRILSTPWLGYGGLLYLNP